MSNILILEKWMDVVKEERDGNGGFSARTSTIATAAFGAYRMTNGSTNSAVDLILNPPMQFLSYFTM